MRSYGFIGSGNMAKAMIGGMISSGLAAPEHIYVSNPTPEKLDRLRGQYGVHTLTGGNIAVAEQADVLVLSVKPHVYPAVIAEIRDRIRPDAIVVLIAAGQTLAANEARFGRPVRLARVMPNTPALVGEAMSAVCYNANMTDADRVVVSDLLGSFGRAAEVPESLMDTVTGVSGSSPAYVYLFIEALADAAVLHGMPRAQAYTFAAQSVLGAAKMVLETGAHPAVLKDNVCSPGGTTIEAVAALEQCGLRSAVMQAVDACVNKSRELSR